MKAKCLKEILSSIPDDSEILCEYSMFIFGEKQPKLYSSQQYAEQFHEDFDYDNAEEFKVDIGADYVIEFFN